MIFYPFNAIFDKKNQCAAFWPVCSKYAAVCSSSGFFGVYWKIMVLFCNKVSQMKIFSPYKAIFNEKNNTLPFGPVCSKYAAVCSNRDFFPMSTPSRCIQHTKVALFPNFGALSIKITSGYILGTHSLD